MKIRGLQFLFIFAGLLLTDNLCAQNQPNSRSPGTPENVRIIPAVKKQTRKSKIRRTTPQPNKEKSSKSKAHVTRQKYSGMRENTYLGLSFGGAWSRDDGYHKWLEQNQYNDHASKAFHFDVGLQPLIYAWKGPGFVGMDIGYSFDINSPTKYEQTRVGFIFGRMLSTYSPNRRMALALSTTFNATSWNFRGQPQLPFNYAQSNNFTTWNASLCLSPSIKLFRILPWKLKGDVNTFTTGFEAGMRFRVLQHWFYRNEETNSKHKKNISIDNAPPLTQVDVFFNIPFGWFWRDVGL